MVNRSVYSTVAGIPVALIGVLGYLALLMLSTLYRSKAETPIMILLGSLAGLGFALYLTYIEKFVLVVWCILCLSSLSVVFLIAVLASVSVTRSMRRPERASIQRNTSSFRRRFSQTALRILNSPLAIFIVALLARLRVIQQLVPGNSWRGFYANNESARIAWSVASGFGFSSPWPRTPLLPTAVEPPVYPYLLSGIFKLAGTYSDLSLWLAVELNAVSRR